jgi:hypothetical protein
MKNQLLKPLQIAIGLLGLTLSGSSIAQQNKSIQRTCGMQAYMVERMKNPYFAEKHILQQQKFALEFQKQTNLSALKKKKITLTIPVAVHFPGANESDRVCLEDMAQKQIDVLNKDFTRTNTDISLWAAASSFYPGVSPGKAEVYFCIATVNHPANTDEDLVEGGKAVTIGYTGFNANNNYEDIKWAGYINFVIMDLGADLLGLSPLAGDITTGQCVRMNLTAFGTGSGCTASGVVPQDNFNLGRTVTHELGHFFNLEHTWGLGGCDSDDNVSDTPNINNSSYGCPANGSVAACDPNEKSLTMSFMDYVNDACMYMFTVGQIARVSAQLATYSFKQNVTQCVITATNTPPTLTQLSIFPNPSHNFINIVGVDDVKQITLYDALGKTVYRNTEITNHQIRVDLTTISKGVYFLKVQAENKTETYKVIKN